MNWIKKKIIFLYFIDKNLENGFLKVKLKIDNVLWFNKIIKLENFGEVVCNKFIFLRIFVILLINFFGRCLKVGILENRIKCGIRI